MSDYEFIEYDFDDPSFLERYIGLPLLRLLGERVYYRPFLSKISFAEEDNVLDFGCGAGESTRSIVNMLGARGRVTGIDTSTFWLKHARKRLKDRSNVTLLHGDIRKTKHDVEHFDKVVIIFVLHDIHPLDRPSIMESIVHTLKPGGQCCVHEPSRFTHGIDPEEVRKIMTDAGLKETQTWKKDNKWFQGIYTKGRD
ncbi:MAG: class I SAM-dependent methyltransferase [Spirochaetota bacterium]